MSLQLTKELDSGVSGNYWRVTNVALDRNTDIAEVRVGLYKDAASRNAGKTELYCEFFYLDGFTLAAIQGASDVVALSYTALKQLPKFADAEDV